MKIEQDFFIETKQDRRYKRYLKEKYLKWVKHKQLGICRGLTKNLQKILIKDKTFIKK